MAQLDGSRLGVMVNAIVEFFEMKLSWGAEIVNAVAVIEIIERSNASASNRILIPPLVITVFLFKKVSCKEAKTSFSP